MLYCMMFIFYCIYSKLYLWHLVCLKTSIFLRSHIHYIHMYIYIYRWFRMDRDRYMHAENVHAQLGRAPNTAQRLSRQRPPCWNHKPLWRCWSNSQTFERQVLRKSCRCRKFEQQTWPNTGRQGNDGIRYGKSQKLGGKPPNPAYPAEVEGLTKKFPRYQWVL